MTKRDDIRHLVEQENLFWSVQFQKEVARDRKEPIDFSSDWWRLYYREITDHIGHILRARPAPYVLEAGSGSGKASLLLSPDMRRVLLDISPSALQFAKYLADKFGCQNVDFIHGDLFKLPFEERSFDLTWNIGVLEHYHAGAALQILKEMCRVTVDGGYLAVGVPNFGSFAIQKARALRSPILNFVPGYRLGTERPYAPSQLVELVKAACHLEGRPVRSTEIRYFGNPLPMGSPAWLLRSLGPLAERRCPHRKFLVIAISRL
ncbi:class I SAM-dependent methyltransferase [Bradyrhizobium sp. Pa8]|uniref:class I SAM-dependent methyltransferase n=1 Tax=Bradyrhizobium sp. Pa8 TaxID=3386552 RepID=UPI00403FBD61